MAGECRRILLTGAGGFAGKAIARHLKQIGYEIMGTVHRHKEDVDFSVVSCDVTKPIAIEGDFDAIVHTAGILPYQNPTFEDYKRVHLDGMSNVIAFAKKCGAKRIIYLSSIGVYGEMRDKHIDEHTDRINPEGYGQTKYMAECLLKESGLETMSLRLPGVIGPGASPVWFVNTVEKFRRNEPVTIYTPQFKTKNFVWIDDLTVFIGELLARPVWEYDCLVLACHESAKIEDIVMEMKRMTHSSSEIIVDNSLREPFCLEARLAQEMGYSSHTPLEIVGEYLNSISDTYKMNRDRSL